MTKVFLAKIRSLSDNSSGITIPADIMKDNNLVDGTDYWFKLMGKLRKPGDEE